MTDSRKPTLAEQLASFAAPRFTPYNPETGGGLDAPAPQYRRHIEDGEYAAPSLPAAHPYGVLFRADHETLADGMCRQARTHALALHRHIPVLLSSINRRVRRPVFDEHGKQLGIESFFLAGDDMLEDEVFQEVGALRRTQVRSYVAAVYYTLVHSAKRLQQLILPEYTRGAIGAAEDVLARTVVYTPWERSTVDPEIIAVLKDVGQVWLQCTRNVEVFAAAGLPRAKMRLVHPAYDTEGPIPALGRTSMRTKGQRFYNIGKWEPRKAQHELIGAFLTTFRPGAEASLTIKTHYFGEWQGYPSHKETLQVWLADEVVRARGWTAENIAKGVRIYDRQFSTEEMTKLHAMHNTYVTLSHAEGWDYPAFDAKTAGNKLIYVGYGGAEDYADPVDDYRVPSKLGPVHPQYGWERGAEWAVTEPADVRTALLSDRPRADPRALRIYGDRSAGLTMKAALGEFVDPSAWRAEPC